MTLARITNYVDGNVLTGAQLNNEFDNILNNGVSLINLGIPTITQVQGLSGSFISNIGSFQARSYNLRTTSGPAASSATSSYSINTQTVGPVANGRDQAGAFASTTVHFYAITTGGTSTNAAGIVSTNAPPTGPTLPAGYSAWCYLGSAIYNTVTSAALVSSLHQGSRVWITQADIVLNSTVDTITAAGVGARVPSIATAISCKINNPKGASTGANGNVEAYYVLQSQPLIGDQYGSMVQHIFDAPTPGGTVPATKTHGTLTGILPNISTTPTLYYYNLPVTGLAGSFKMDVCVDGFIVPNGDVS